MPNASEVHITRNPNNVKGINVEINFFKIFFLSGISEWNKLDLKITDSATFGNF